MASIITTTTINSLPPELTIHILNFLDSPSYFEPRLRDDPAEILPNDNPSSSSSSSFNHSTDFKNASLVCRRWRQATLPLLFRHVVWTFRRIEVPTPQQLSTARDSSPGLEFLEFLKRERLRRGVESLTVVVDHPRDLFGPETLEYGIVTGREAVSAPGGQGEGGEASMPSEDADVRDNNWLWHAVFSHIDPLRLTIIAYPGVLASLLGRTANLSSAWFFQAPFHILSLSRPAAAQRRSVDGGGETSLMPLPSHLPSQTTGHQLNSAASVPCDLFSIRDWSSLLINEGSFISVYATYEYYNHTAPSLLPLLLNLRDPSLQHLLQHTLTTLSYIAIFPVSRHLSTHLIPRLPPALRRFYVQIVPRRLDFLDEGRRQRRPSLDPKDLWMEWAIAYTELLAVVVRAARGQDGDGGEGVARRLDVFEMGDTADKGMWTNAMGYVEAVTAGAWNVAGEGIFVRAAANSNT